MNKIKHMLNGLLVALTMGWGGAAFAAPMVSVDPGVEFGTVGDSIFVDVLYDGTSPTTYLGDFDIDVAFNDSVLAFVGGTFDFFVDSLGCLPLVTCDAFDLGGVVDVFQISEDSEADLIANQDALGNAGLLVTLEFEAIAEGISLLELSSQAFGNEAGDLITLALTDGLICIDRADCTRAVPVPGTLWLFALGAIGLCVRSRQLRG